MINKKSDLGCVWSFNHKIFYDLKVDINKQKDLVKAGRQYCVTIYVVDIFGSVTWEVRVVLFYNSAILWNKSSFLNENWFL